MYIYLLKFTTNLQLLWKVLLKDNKHGWPIIDNFIKLFHVQCASEVCANIKNHNKTSNAQKNFPVCANINRRTPDFFSMYKKRIPKLTKEDAVASSRHCILLLFGVVSARFSFQGLFFFFFFLKSLLLNLAGKPVQYSQCSMKCYVFAWSCYGALLERPALSGLRRMVSHPTFHVNSKLSC